MRRCWSHLVLWLVAWTSSHLLWSSYVSVCLPSRACYQSQDSWVHWSMGKTYTSSLSCALEGREQGGTWSQVLLGREPCSEMEGGSCRNKCLDLSSQFSALLLASCVYQGGRSRSWADRLHSHAHVLRHAPPYHSDEATDRHACTNQTCCQIFLMFLCPTPFPSPWLPLSVFHPDTGGALWLLTLAPY